MRQKCVIKKYPNLQNEKLDCKREMSSGPPDTRLTNGTVYCKVIINSSSVNTFKNGQDNEKNEDGIFLHNPVHQDLTEHLLPSWCSHISYDTSYDILHLNFKSTISEAEITNIAAPPSSLLPEFQGYCTYAKPRCFLV